MRYFLDCGLLIFYGFLSLFFVTPGPGFLVAFLCILLLLCSSYVIERREFLVALGAGFGLLALVIPENFFSIPVLYILCFMKKCHAWQ